MLVAAWGAGRPAHAQAQDPIAESYGPGYRYMEGEGYRDPNDRIPVAIGIRLISLSDIDSREETFTIEAILYVNWSDDWGDEQQAWTEESVDAKLRTLSFRPAPEFENGQGVRKRYGLSLSYDPDQKRVEYEERFSMQFANDLDFVEFPFDEQLLSVKIIVNSGREGDVDLRIKEFTHGPIDMAEWYTEEGSYSSTIEHNIIPYNIDDPNAAEEDRFPRARFDIKIQRRSGFYLWRVLLPLILITAVSWAMFWMEPKDLSGRLGVSFTALLTVVAYNLILGDILPRIAYLTFLDALITMTYVWLGAAVLESVVVSALHRGEHERLSAIIDRFARVGFPMTYLIGLTVVIGLFL